MPEGARGEFLPGGACLNSMLRCPLLNQGESPPIQTHARAERGTPRRCSERNRHKSVRRESTRCTTV